MPSLQSSNSLPAKKSERFFSPVAVWLLRVIIGGVFVLSGFVKSIDTWGSFYKISEYLTVWGLEIPSRLVVITAFLLGGVEFVLGSLLLLGCYRRSAPVLMLAMMAFMLPLTAYLLNDNPVSDCGCFGDFIVISNTASFLKNIALTAGLIYLLIYNKCVGGLFVPYVQWIVGGLLSLYILLVSLFGYNVQPMIDFRRFAPGFELLSGLNDMDDDDNEPVYEFVYEKDGDTKAFTLDNLPDSTWTFIDRRLIAGSDAVTEGFSIMENGEDITEDVISADGDQFIVTIPDMKAVDLSYTYLLNDLNDYMEARGGSMVALVSGSYGDLEWWRDVSMASYPIYSVDPILVKELARGRAALVYLKDGVVQWKRTLSSISYSYVSETPSDEIVEELDPHVGYVLDFMTFVLLAVLLIVFILDRSGRLVGWLLKRNKKKTAMSK